MVKLGILGSKGWYAMDRDTRSITMCLKGDTKVSIPFFLPRTPRMFRWYPAAETAFFKKLSQIGDDNKIVCDVCRRTVSHATLDEDKAVRCYWCVLSRYDRFMYPARTNNKQTPVTFRKSQFLRIVSSIGEHKYFGSLGTIQNGDAHTVDLHNEELLIATGYKGHCNIDRFPVHAVICS